MSSERPATVVLHRDADVVAVDKPTGVAVIPGRNEPPTDCLRAWVERDLGLRLWVVHRIDRDVSGVVLFARNAAAHRRLSTDFEQGVIGKRYWALVDGVVAEPEGRIDLALRTGLHGGRSVVDAVRGKPSLTIWRRQRTFAAFTILECEPRTGRTHQIRVHLRAIGHPLAVDRRYGKRTALRRQDLDGGSDPTVIVARATLHAARLSVGDLHIEAPLPADLTAAVAILERVVAD